MRVLALIGALILLVGLASSSRGSITLLGVGSAGGAPNCPTYTGPGDVSGLGSPTIFFSTRAFKASSCGTKLMNVCNVSDVACVDWLSSTVNGAMSVTTVGGSDCGSVTCTVKTWYDLSANGTDASQATVANRETIVLNGINTSLPVLNSVNGVTKMNATLGGSVSQPYTMVAVGKRITDPGSNVRMLTFGASEIGFGFTGGAATAFIYAGTAPVAQAETENVFHTFAGLGNGSSSSMTVDATTSSTGNAGSTASGTATGVLYDQASGSNAPTGRFTEVGFYPIGFTGTQITNMHNNQCAYYGTTC